MEAFLTIRGARTLGLRLERAQQNAMELATRLDQHAGISRVLYPGLPGHGTHAVREVVHERLRGDAVVRDDR